MQVVADRYRLDSERGTGGTATVWLVHDLVLDRPAALKLLHPVERGADSRRERLRTEARSLAVLDHPHVVRVWDFGQHDGHDFIVMEYLERGSLADRLAAEGPLPPAEATDLLIQVLDALQAAHSAGIVHRDVKPGNVLIRGDGQAALCDFGIARTASGGGETLTGVALGSIGFMAPEQRIDPRLVGPQADLYAAACTLYNLLTADTPVDLYLAPDSSPRWDAVPLPLRPVLRRATRSEPSARFQTATEMVDALRSVQSALDHLPAASSRMVTPPPGYAVTRGGEPEPSVHAEHRVRDLGLDDYGWAHRQRAPVGRTALWVGLAVTLAATGVSVILGPLHDQLRIELPEPVPEPPPAIVAPALAGTWQGTFDGYRGTMVLHGTASALTGEVAVHLGSHELRTRVAGGLDPGGQLTLIETSVTEPAIYSATLGRTGLILEGSLTRHEQPPVPFALVRME